MKSRSLKLILVMLLVASGTIHAQDVIGELFGRINGLRHSLGLPDYRLNSALTAAAQDQAQWMASTGGVVHQRPDGSTPRTRTAAHGYGSTWVGENIYMGGLATIDSAWNFWINSPIHYAGLTSPSYQDIGIGTAHTDAYGTAYVLVFGNPGGASLVQQQANAKSDNAAAPASQPSYVVGVDSHGNIMHQIQEGDTLGDIALIYGYTWADLPYMLKLNGMTQADARELEVGSIFLVPPQAGTYTPSPVSQSAALTLTAAVTATPAPSSTSFATATLAPLAESPFPTAPALHIATAADVPPVMVTLVEATSTLTPPSPVTEIAIAATPVPDTPLRRSDNGGTSPWLIVAVVMQVGIVLVAAVEFIRRSRR